MARRAEVVAAADKHLSSAVGRLRSRFRLERPTADIVRDIKGAMHSTVPPHGLSVLQTLSDRERDKAFNADAARAARPVHREFKGAVEAVAKAGGADERRAERIAKNAWTQDAAADRRTRQREGRPASEWRSPYRGRPDRYAPEVVAAFMRAITQASQRTTFERGNRGSGIMVEVLRASMWWAMLIAWETSAPFSTKPPCEPAREGILRIVLETKRRGRPKAEVHSAD